MLDTGAFIARERRNGTMVSVTPRFADERTLPFAHLHVQLTPTIAGDPFHCSGRFLADGVNKDAEDDQPDRRQRFITR